MSDNIYSIINGAEHPVVMLLTTEPCNGQFPTTLKERLETHEKEFHFHEQCVAEEHMPFPRFQSPAVYYFLPKNHTPIFWRGQDALFHLDNDIEVLYKMMNGTSFMDAMYPGETKQKVIEGDAMLKMEDIKKYPPFFQQARGFAKEIWETGKRAANALPILVPAETAFQRMETCQGCEKFDKNTSRCSACGCFMKTKSHLASATCPLSKWSS